MVLEVRIIVTTLAIVVLSTEVPYGLLARHSYGRMEATVAIMQAAIAISGQRSLFLR